MPSRRVQHNVVEALARAIVSYVISVGFVTWTFLSYSFLIFEDLC